MRSTKRPTTRLERTVAIKVLPAHVASDPERKQRFEREAKTVAALSHPHICPVFDVGFEVPSLPDGNRGGQAVPSPCEGSREEQAQFEVPSPPRGEGQGEGDALPIDFLVMEYLVGETLAEHSPSRADESDSVVWADRAGREDPLPGLALGRVADVRISPDGTRFVVTSLEEETADLWTYDIVRGVPSRLTTDPGVDRNPVWTPDGRRVIFTSTRDGQSELFWRAADGTGTPERLLSREGKTDLSAAGLTPDGTHLLFVETADQTGDIGLLSLQGEPTAETLLDAAFTVAAPAVSPDGGWIAYYADGAGQFEVYVERFPRLGDRQQISTNGGRHPRWSPDGRELFYRNGRSLLAVPITPGPPFRAGAPTELFTGPYRQSDGVRQPFDLAPDGERLPHGEAAGWPDRGRRRDAPDHLCGTLAGRA